MKQEGTKFDFPEIRKKGNSGFILRSKIDEVTGDLLHGRTMANLDSLGQGIPGRISIGRKVAYPTENVIRFLQSKIKVLD